MKIPQTTPNVGAYYGNEENGQWQPNGMMVDSGVGGGVVGSGDAGMHRPRVYPMHIPRGHVPAGYVMAGAYYPPAGYPPVPAAPVPDDFADYMWMENEEEFDKQVMQQLEEEALMEQCIEAMLEDEQRERQHRPPVANGHNPQYPTTSNGSARASLEEAVSRSTLNPLAAEFVPTRTRPRTHARTDADERREPPEPPATVAPQKPTEEPATHATAAPHTDTADTTEHTEHSHTEAEPTPPAPTDTTPEVSAADITPLTEKPLDKRPPKEHRKDTKTHPVKVDPKKPLKTVIKPKDKPVAVRSETKVQPKKKEVKTVKSETKTEEKPDEIIVPIVEAPKPQPTTPLEDSTPSTGGFKPINYAAAAKANKPKKPSPPPADRTAPPPTKTDKPKPLEKSDKKDKPKVDKPAVKTEKTPLQRKNSANGGVRRALGSTMDPTGSKCVSAVAEPERAIIE